MQRYLILVILFSVFLVDGCKTDFDINADYKDITIVYCLLNQNDSIHYARINKAFLGDGNALIMAEDPANTLYPYDELNVTMEEWLNGNLQTTYLLDTVVINNKESGVFSFPTNVLYAFKAQLNQGCKYKLKIQNKKSGKLVEAEANIVNDFRYEKPYVPPVPPPPLVYQLPSLSFIGTSAIELEWKSAKNGVRYQANMIFYYQEISVNDTVVKQMNWNLGTVKSTNLNGGETLKIEINKESFFVRLKDNIPYNPDVRRKTLYLDFSIAVAGNEFNTYMEVNEPSSSLIQEKPEYTNISNGIGIFCSRYVKDKVSSTDPRPIRFKLNPQSITELKTGAYTNQLGFID